MVAGDQAMPPGVAADRDLTAWDLTRESARSRPGTHRPRLGEELMIPVSAPDRQSQDRPGGLLGAEVQPAELEHESKRRLARLIAVVDVIPVASVLDRDVRRGRGLVALAGVD